MDEPGIVSGPVLVREARMLAVPSGHPFAHRDSVSLEDLARVRLLRLPETAPDSLRRDRTPPRPDARSSTDPRPGRSTRCSPSSAPARELSSLCAYPALLRSSRRRLRPLQRRPALGMGSPVARRRRHRPRPRLQRGRPQADRRLTRAPLEVSVEDRRPPVRPGPDILEGNRWLACPPLRHDHVNYLGRGPFTSCGTLAVRRFMAVAAFSRAAGLSAGRCRVGATTNSRAGHAATLTKRHVPYLTSRLRLGQSP
jgi:hypothetical protein